MKFPKEKAQVLALSHTVSNGLTANAGTFPQPPVKPGDIDTAMTNYDAKSTEIVAAEAVVKQLYEEREVFYEEITDGTTRNLRYVEAIAGGDAGTLALVGWGNPSARTPLQPPGQPRVLEIIGQGDAWVQIDWKEPIDGGKVASYVVRRSENGGDFVDAKTETASESILLNQPTGKKLAYQVVAINRAGESVASNTISLVL